MSEFDHVNLNTIDPATAPFEAGKYNLQVVDAGMKEFEYKKGDRKGTKDKFIKLAVAIVDSDKYTGRKVYSSFFAGKGTLKQLRRLMDATGIAQEAGTPIEQWLTDLKDAKATFNAPVAQQEVKFSDGQVKPQLVINYWEIAPSS